MLTLDSYLNNLDLLNHCANCLAERDNLSHCKACRYIRYSGADSGFLERGSCIQYIYRCVCVCVGGGGGSLC